MMDDNLPPFDTTLVADAPMQAGKDLDVLTLSRPRIVP